MEYPHHPAPADFPVLDAIRERWSPRAIGGQPVEQEKIHSMFEAARWAPSSSNLQPWHFLYATKDDGEDRTKIESLLMEGNSWAKEAYLLVIGFANGKRKKADGTIIDNRYALFDAGAATMSLVLQLPSLGLVGHQMGGFDNEHANDILGVPADFIPASMIAVGYYAESEEALAPDQKSREHAPRVRHPQQEFVYHRQWPTKA